MGYLHIVIALFFGQLKGFCGKKQPMPVGMGGPEIRCKVMIGGR